MKNIQLTHDFFSKEFEDVFGEYRWKYFFSNPFSTIFYFLNKVKWFFQRAFRGWADCDVWNMDAYLAKVISQMTRNLGENTFNNIPREKMKPKDVIFYNALKNIEDGFSLYSPYGTQAGCVAKMQQETEEALSYFEQYFTSLRLKRTE